MANICNYRAIIKGKKENCYAFAGALPVYNNSGIEKEIEGRVFELWYKGDCKWSVDQYASENLNIKKLTVPEDVDEAFEFGEEYRDLPVEQKSKLFGVEVWLAECDIDDYYGVYQRHFKKGVEDDDILDDEPFLTMEADLERLGLEGRYDVDYDDDYNDDEDYSDGYEIDDYYGVESEDDDYF